MLLLHRMHVRSTRMTWPVNDMPHYAFYVRVREAQGLQNLLTIRHKRERLERAVPKNNLNTPKSFNNVMLDPITCIEEVPSSHPFVYDLTVADTFNMVEGSGIGLRDTFHAQVYPLKTLPSVYRGLRNS